MIDTLLTTKLYLPAVHPNAIRRLRLVERLDTGPDLGHRLTLISAPAGYDHSNSHLGGMAPARSA